MRTNPSPHGTPAFTRVELLFCIVGALLLLPAILPLAGGVNAGSELTACRNNLRQIGHGFLGWASDHGDGMPWRTPVIEGGTMTSPKTGNNWLEMGILSNYLYSPKLLVCPSDSGKKAATLWGNAPSGLLHAANRDNAVSYFISLHVYRDNPDYWISGDRHFNPSRSTPESCSTGVNNAWGIVSGSSSVAWTNAIHGLIGNLLLNDGRVETVDTQGLQKSIDFNPHIYGPGQSRIHYLPAF